MRTFVAVVQAGSMNATAGKHTVTSALVGQRIAALETPLQGRLLNRTACQHGRLRLAAPLSFGSEALIPTLKNFPDMTPGVEID